MHVVPDTGSADTPAALLAATSLFRGLTTTDIATITTACERRDVAAGSWCLREGERGDTLYLLVSGRLRVYVGDEPRGEIRSGEFFGEIALLTGRPRTSSIRAVRDSVLLALPADMFAELVDRHPQLLRQVAQVVVDRLISAERPAQSPESDLVITLIPLSGARTLVDEVLTLMVDAFGEFGSATVARKTDSPDRMGRAGWAHALERSHRFVVYLADRENHDWFDWCVRQADRLLLLADASVSPSAADRLLGKELAGVAPLTSSQLLLVHRTDTTTPRGTAGWIDAVIPGVRGLAWHHVRHRRRQDFARVARLVSGRGVGLVLGGGGARGLAHLGAMRALDEAGIPVDAVGGTSIGAVMGSFRALDLDSAARHREAIGGLVDSGFLFAPTLPVMSLSSGRKIRRLLEEGVQGDLGEMDVEDCWLHFFCVSSSLTRAEPVIHERGDLSRAVLASLSLPGLLPPVRHGQELLLDGGLLNNLPIDVMRGVLGGGSVIAVDLGVDVEMTAPATYDESPSGWRLLVRRLSRIVSGQVPEERALGLVGVLMRAKELASLRAERELSAQHRADLHLRPPVAGSPMLDFRSARDLADVAYHHTAAQLVEQGWNECRW